MRPTFDSDFPGRGRNHAHQRQLHGHRRAALEAVVPGSVAGAPRRTRVKVDLPVGDGGSKAPTRSDADEQARSAARAARRSSLLMPPRLRSCMLVLALAVFLLRLHDRDRGRASGAGTRAAGAEAHARPEGGADRGQSRGHSLSLGGSSPSTGFDCSGLVPGPTDASGSRSRTARTRSTTKGGWCRQGG